MFDTFVTERSKSQRKGLRYTMSFSAFVHVAAGVVIVGWSFWTIEKLIPRYVPVSFQPDFRLPPPPPEPPPLPPVHSGTTTKGPSIPRHPTDPQVPAVVTSGPSTPGTDTPQPPGVDHGDPNGILTVQPQPPPEIQPPPPKPPGLSEAERHALVLAYLHDTVQPTVLRHFAYPSDAQRNGLEGTVTIRLTIDAGGRLKGTEIVSCPDPILCQAALGSANEAAPFPRPPAELGTVTVDVRFEYHLD